MIKKISILAAVLLFFGAGVHIYSSTIVIKGGEIHTMDGKVIKAGIILIREGKIAEIGEGIPIPEEAEVIQADGFILYPGFIAPAYLSASEDIKNFESFSPDATALDRFDFYGDYTRYLGGGVTSVYVSTARNRLISGKGAVVKLGNGKRESTVVKKEASLTVNFGTSPLLPPMVDIFPAPINPENPIIPSRRQFPSSILGAFWVLNELFRFEPYSGSMAKYMENISASLKKAQEQKMPLMVRCQKATDIYWAVKLAQNLKMPLIIHGAAEAFKLVDVLKENNVYVVAEAFVRPNGIFPKEEFLAEEGVPVYEKNIPTLIKEGITVAITPDSDKYLPDLLWVANYFRKYGISEDKLIETLTINPALILNVKDRIGSLEKGKDADILFFQKKSGALLPRLKKVMIEGRIVYED